MQKDVFRSKKLIVFLLLILVGCTFIFSSFFIYKHYYTFKARVNYAHVPDATIAYYTRGQGDPLILIEGFGMTMQDWDPLLLEKLSQNHQLIIFDYPTIGLSTGDISKLSQTELADDVVSLMDKLKIRKTHILGWSMGSFVAQIIAEKYPTRVNKLILISTAPGGGQTISPPDTISASIQNNLAGSWETVYVPLLFPATEKTKMEAYIHRLHSAIAKDEAPKDKAALSLNLLGTFENLLGDAQQEQLRYDALPTITSPTLIISGDKDILLIPTNSRRVAERIPHSQLVIIPEAGHAVLFQDVDTVSTFVNNFIK